MHATSTHTAPAGAAAPSPRIHLVIGPVGAGKSTFARQLVPVSYTHVTLPTTPYV